eukprot:11209115-Prorocentrum_lima.AAC.1
MQRCKEYLKKARISNVDLRALFGSVGSQLGLTRRHLRKLCGSALNPRYTTGGGQPVQVLNKKRSNGRRGKS